MEIGELSGMKRTDYDPTTDTFTAPVVPVQTLQDAQQAKVAELTHAYDQALAVGFTSTANVCKRP